MKEDLLVMALVVVALVLVVMAANAYDELLERYSPRRIRLKDWRTGERAP